MGWIRIRISKNSKLDTEHWFHHRLTKILTAAVCVCTVAIISLNSDWVPNEVPAVGLNDGPHLPLVPLQDALQQQPERGKFWKIKGSPIPSISSYIWMVHHQPCLLILRIWSLHTPPMAPMPTTCLYLIAVALISLLFLIHHARCIPLSVLNSCGANLTDVPDLYTLLHACFIPLSGSCRSDLPCCSWPRTQ